MSLLPSKVTIAGITGPDYLLHHKSPHRSVLIKLFRNHVTTQPDSGIILSFFLQADYDLPYRAGRIVDGVPFKLLRTRLSHGILAVDIAIFPVMLKLEQEPFQKLLIEALQAATKRMAAYSIKKELDLDFERITEDIERALMEYATMDPNFEQSGHDRVAERFIKAKRIIDDAFDG